jgi:hypothetical protein
MCRLWKKSDNCANRGVSKINDKSLINHWLEFEIPSFCINKLIDDKSITIIFYI